MNLNKIAYNIVSSNVKNASSTIKINQSYRGFDGLYEIENTKSQQGFIYFNSYVYGCGFYLVFNKKTQKFNVNLIEKLEESDFEKGVSHQDFLDSLRHTTTEPNILSELEESLTETISFYTLMDLFNKYNFDYVGDRRVSNGSQHGIRYELTGDGDYDAMIKEIKDNANFPEKVIAGGTGTYKYAPELTRKSLIIIE
jgi:hypothetical protein